MTITRDSGDDLSHPHLASPSRERRASGIRNDREGLRDSSPDYIGIQG